MNKILILDIETTGFLNQNGSIIEIGMVELNLDNGEIKTVYDSLLKYNNNFDFSFLESRGIEFPKKLPDPMKLLTDIMKLPNNNGYNNYKWPSVEEAYKYLFPESNYIEKHRGADDAKHEAEIIYKLYEMGIFKI